MRADMYIYIYIAFCAFATKYVAEANTFFQRSSCLASLKFRQYLKHLRCNSDASSTEGFLNQCKQVYDRVSLLKLKLAALGLREPKTCLEIIGDFEQLRDSFIFGRTGLLLKLHSSGPY